MLLLTFDDVLSNAMGTKLLLPRIEIILMCFVVWCLYFLFFSDFFASGSSKALKALQELFVIPFPPLLSPNLCLEIAALSKMKILKETSYVTCDSCGEWLFSSSPLVKTWKWDVGVAPDFILLGEELGLGQGIPHPLGSKSSGGYPIGRIVHLVALLQDLV